MSKLGTFYGIGVGPGDPELMTLKAVRILHEVDVVFTAGHERSGKSLANEIAASHIGPQAEIVALPFSHTFEGVEGRAIHREAAAKILEVLSRPMSAAFLTLGDPMTFSTFTYVLEALLELDPSVPVVVVPGVTSFAAAAAATLTPLAEGEETLTIVGAAKGTEGLEGALKHADNLVIMKPYRQTERVCDLLDEAGLGETTLFCTECSRPTEVITKGTAGARNATGRYMSLFLAKRGRGLAR